MRLCHATAAQPQSQHGKQGKVVVPDISELSVHLQQQWHPDNNAWLGGIKVKPHSGKRVKWSCPNCPLGRPHVWETTVQLRTSGSKCPYCLNKRVCKHNSLATKAPKQWKYWNHEKNAKTPEQVNAGSSLRVHWKCPDCRLTWQAPVSARTRRDAGCPSCCCDHKHSLEYRKTTPRRVTFFKGTDPPRMTSGTWSSPRRFPLRSLWMKTTDPQTGTDAIYHMLFHWTLPSTKCRGKPRTVWNDVVLSDVHKLKPNHYIRDAQNKPVWRELTCVART